MKRSLLVSLLATAGIVTLAGCFGECGSCNKKEAAPVEQAAPVAEQAEQTEAAPVEADHDHADHDHAAHADEEAK